MSTAGVQACVGQRGDGGVLAVGDGPADGEFAVHVAVPQCSDVGEERLGCAGAVGADQDRVAVAILVRDLRQRCIEQRDVVGGGVVG